MTAMCGTALVIVGARRLTSASVAFSGIGKSSSSAAISVTMPMTASCGAASRIASVTPRQLSPPASSHLVVPPPEPSLGVIAANGSRETISRNGLNTATQAASIPPPTAIAKFCQVTTRSVPTAKAEER